MAWAWLDRLLRRKPRVTAAQAEASALLPPDGFRAGVEAFCWRVLVDAYTRILARQRGRDPLTVSRAEQADWLAPYYEEIDRDARALGAAIAQARVEGMGQLHQALHRTALDHEMVDQAFAWAHSHAAAGSKEGR